jgi:uncharacterized membrane protein
MVMALRRPIFLPKARSLMRSDGAVGAVCVVLVTMVVVVVVVVCGSWFVVRGIGAKVCFSFLFSFPSSGICL